MSILSIQSHVAYGYVGNKAAVYPLQAMGYDVWPVNTVQFSNHTGYGTWQGQVFSEVHIQEVIQGLVNLGLIAKTRAILSGYMGSLAICHEVLKTVRQFKSENPDILYLCDPVIGNTHCFVPPAVLSFFKEHLEADIITPNQYEAELLSGIPIEHPDDLKAVSAFFHAKGCGIVIITGIQMKGFSPNILHIYGGQEDQHYLYATPEYIFPISPNGTGDLFSALFLGSYLHRADLAWALTRSIVLMDAVLARTAEKQQRELAVLEVDYKPMELPAAKILKLIEI